MRFDVAALGELVIDMVPVAGAGGRLFAAKPGGAPGNVAAGVARLGLRAAMLSNVGPGHLGDLLITALAQAGVETRGIVRALVETTALAVVSTSPPGHSVGLTSCLRGSPVGGVSTASLCKFSLASRMIRRRESHEPHRRPLTSTRSASRPRFDPRDRLANVTRGATLASGIDT